jgi:hypothetical protein
MSSLLVVVEQLVLSCVPASCVETGLVCCFVGSFDGTLCQVLIVEASCNLLGYLHAGLCAVKAKMIQSSAFSKSTPVVRVLAKPG